MIGSNQVMLRAYAEKKIISYILRANLCEDRSHEIEAIYEESNKWMRDFNSYLNRQVIQDEGISNFMNLKEHLGLQRILLFALSKKSGARLN